MYYGKERVGRSGWEELMRRCNGKEQAGVKNRAGVGNDERERDGGITKIQVNLEDKLARASRNGDKFWWTGIQRQLWLGPVDWTTQNSGRMGNVTRDAGG